MAIHPPGERFRYSKLMKMRKGKRDVTAVLSLTAMVDMFTVLVIFLLQNYNTTGQVIFIPKDVILPKAGQTKELKPSVVVTISAKEILLDKNVVATFDQVHGQKDWMIEPLRTQLVDALAKAKADFDNKNQIKEVIDTARGDAPEQSPDWNKVTVQADKGIDFLTVKKVMYTVTESGAGEINFAVNKEATTVTK